MNKERTRRGFTLIELLVVVLIIGILAAVALPQYNKAVIKARFAEAQANLKSLAQAVKVCQLSGKDCNTFDDLDISLGTKYTPFHYNTDLFIYNVMDAILCTDADCESSVPGYITVAYRKEPVCLCYSLTNDKVSIAGSNWCDTDDDEAEQTQNYNQLLGLDTNASCSCC